MLEKYCLCKISKNNTDIDTHTLPPKAKPATHSTEEKPSHQQNVGSITTTAIQ
jgi:hypothetical protein